MSEEIEDKLMELGDKLWPVPEELVSIYTSNHVYKDDEGNVVLHIERDFRIAPITRSQMSKIYKVFGKALSNKDIAIGVTQDSVENPYGGSISNLRIKGADDFGLW